MEILLPDFYDIANILTLLFRKIYHTINNTKQTIFKNEQK